MYSRAQTASKSPARRIVASALRQIGVMTAAA
jgi:hypothetical protein